MDENESIVKIKTEGDNSGARKVEQALGKVATAAKAASKAAVVDVHVNEPDPVDVEVNEPDTVKVPVDQPDPVDVKVNEPDTVKVPVEQQPDPVDVKVNEPDAVKVPVEQQPDPVDVEVNEPDAVKVPVEQQPDPVDVEVNEPDAVKVPVDADADAVEKASQKAADWVRRSAEETAVVVKDAAKKAADSIKDADFETEKTVADSFDKISNTGTRTKKALDDVADQADEVGKNGSASVGKLSSAMNVLRRAAGLARNVLTGFGVVGVFSMLASAVGKVTESFGAAKKEAEELAKAKDKAAHAKEVEDLAKAYEQLGESMRKASEAMQRANELEDIATRNARALEDAQLDLAKQKELAAIDANDPAAAEKRAQIEARYAAQRGETAANRSREDIERTVDRMEEEASGKRRAAVDIENSVDEDDAVIADVKRRRDAALKRSLSLNREDNMSTASQIGSDLKNIVTLNWGKVTDTKTAAGDAIRKEAAAEAKELDAELKRLREQRAEKLKQAEALHTEADQLVKKAEAERKGYDVADTQEMVSFYEGQRATSEADRAREKKEKQVAKDRQTIDEGGMKKADLETRAANEKARAQAAADAYAKEQADVFTAQNRYDMLVHNGGSKKEKSAALAALQKEKAEALEAQHEMEKVAAEVANVLKAIKEEVGTLSRSVKAAQSRLKQNEADAPEG